MATFDFNGADELILSMEELVRLPEEVLDEILIEQADFFVDEVKERAYAYGMDADSEMVRSIKRGKPKRGKKWGRQVVVSPRGSRKRVNTVTKNTEIAFLVNYGKRGQQPNPFWTDTEKVTAKSLDKIGLAVYEKFLKKCGL